MIFVTVGTHEQQFNRLIETIDQLKGKGIIKEEVEMQIGFSTYEPQYCKWSKLIPYKEMGKKIRQARIVITHGGPASFVAPLQIGKIPIVVPRQYKYGEHVNNHQLEFCKSVEKKYDNIILVDDIKKIKDIILGYDELVNEKISGIDSNNNNFNKEIEKIVYEMMR